MRLEHLATNLAGMLALVVIGARGRAGVVGSFAVFQQLLVVQETAVASRTFDGDYPFDHDRNGFVYNRYDFGVIFGKQVIVHELGSGDSVLAEQAPKEALPRSSSVFVMIGTPVVQEDFLRVAVEFARTALERRLKNDAVNIVKYQLSCCW